jgi:hypothetical protein
MIYFRLVSGRTLSEMEFPGRKSIRHSTVEYSEHAVEQLKLKVF